MFLYTTFQNYFFSKLIFELHFLFNCNLYDSLRSNFYRNISNRYPLFNNFDNNEKTLFLFNNVDPHIYRLTAANIHSCMEYRKKKLVLELWPLF